MLKYLLIAFLLLSMTIVAQTEETYQNIEELFKYEDSDTDTLIYNKTLDYYNQRNFDDDLKTKYSGKEFEYIDDLKEEKQQEKKEKTTNAVDAKLFISFMSNVFPYLLGLLAVFIIVKSFLNTESGFWKFGKFSKKSTTKLIYEDDDDIDKNDYEKLLSLAQKNRNYRLATRYYYLFLLKELSQNGLITYHKDKTNTDYKFELQNKDIRTEFSYLAYIYDYVWYGEFPIDEIKFNAIEHNYKNFINTI